LKAVSIEWLTFYRIQDYPYCSYFRLWNLWAWKFLT